VDAVVALPQAAPAERFRPGIAAVGFGMPQKIH
jgi:hypothetical protein